MALFLSKIETRSSSISLRAQAPRVLAARLVEILDGMYALARAQEWISTHQLIKNCANRLSPQEVLSLEESRQLVASHYDENGDILSQRMAITWQLGTPHVLLFGQAQMFANPDVYMTCVMREAAAAQENHWDLSIISSINSTTSAGQFSRTQRHICAPFLHAEDLQLERANNLWDQEVARVRGEDHLCAPLRTFLTQSPI